MSMVKRNSSLELLRILSMVMILTHHYVIHNGYSIELIPFGINRFLLQILLLGGGQVGVVIFLSISTWFFLDEKQSFSHCFNRICKLEQELVFYSLILLLFTVLFDRQDFDIHLVTASIMPTIFQCWWYATAYILLLFFLPALQAGLLALGRELHLKVAFVMLVLFGVIALVPGTFIPGRDVFGFIYYIVLLSAYKWYCKPLRTRTLIQGIVAGYGIYILCWIGLSPALGIGDSYGVFIMEAWRLPVLMIGASIFLLAERRTFYNGIINRLASVAFGVYLISEYPTVRTLLWTRLFRIDSMMAIPFHWLAIAMMIVGIYLLFGLFDFGRQWIFSVAVERIPMPNVSSVFKSIVVRYARTLQTRLIDAN